MNVLVRLLPYAVMYQVFTYVRFCRYENCTAPFFMLSCLRAILYQEKYSAAFLTAADKGCCRDFTHPCKAPAFPSTLKTAENRLKPTWLKTDANKDERDPVRFWTAEYGKGGLFWPYGGSGMFLSAGLIDSVQQGSSGTGWELSLIHI